MVAYFLFPFPTYQRLLVSPLPHFQIRVIIIRFSIEKTWRDGTARRSDNFDRYLIQRRPIYVLFYFLLLSLLLPPPPRTHTHPSYYILFVSPTTKMLSSIFFLSGIRRMYFYYLFFSPLNVILVFVIVERLLIEINFILPIFILRLSSRNNIA